MLAAAFYVLDAIRRAFDKTNRGLAMLADAFEEAQDFRRAAQRRHPHIEE
jgi:hypothetical protein